jgi:hypothetical protein
MPAKNCPIGIGLSPSGKILQPISQLYPRRSFEPYKISFISTPPVSKYIIIRQNIC